MSERLASFYELASSYGWSARKSTIDRLLSIVTEEAPDRSETARLREIAGLVRGGECPGTYKAEILQLTGRLAGRVRS
jgi:hypothetical protein